jgi:hypothetical protein
VNRVRTTAAALGASALLSGCGGDSPREPDTRADESQPAPATTTPAEALQPASCPAGLANCRTASGRILYVERVDPDGDGDAHFVLLSKESITAPGVSIVDVRQDLRPSPLPGPGDRISAAGPVYPGSRGQKQIEAVVVHTAG